MNILNNPGTWDELLDVAPFGSILAGGAIVDFVMDHDAKDYDIFHHYKLGMPVTPASWVYVEPGPDHDEDYVQNEAGVNVGKIGSVYNYDVTVDGDAIVRVQMIGVMMEPTHYMKTFDHSLCLGAYTQDGLTVHKQVFQSLKNQQVFCLSDYNKPKSLERALRKVKKYDPDGYANWAFINF